MEYEFSESKHNMPVMARENIAFTISDQKIHREVMSNICKLVDIDINMKVDLMFQSIPDLAEIYFILKHFNRIGRIPDREYAQILKIITERVSGKKSMVECDPRYLVQG